MISLVIDDGFLHLPIPGLDFFLHAANEMVGLFCIAFWLRSARGCSTTTAVVFIGIAISLSEIVIGLCWALPFVARGAVSRYSP